MDELKTGHNFSLTVESISSVEARFLEVLVRKEPNHYTIAPASKPSSLSVPWLSRFSSHHSSIHRCWPHNRMKDRLNLCSDLKSRIAECKDFKLRAQEQFLSSAALNKILATNPDDPRAGTNHFGVPGCQAKKPVVFWLVLPFIPALFKAGIANLLTKFLNSQWAITQLQLAFGFPVNIKLAWQNVLPSVKQYLKPNIHNMIKSQSHAGGERLSGDG